MMRRLVAISARYANRKAEDVGKICVIGAGQSGGGITQMIAQAHITCTLIDQDPLALEQTQENMEHFVNQYLRKKYADWPEAIADFQRRVMGRISFVDSIDPTCKDAEFVIDATSENTEKKALLFESLDKVCNPETTFVSNTTSCPLATISAGLSDQRKTQFGALHFHSPIPVTKVCELITVPGVTSDKTTETLKEFAEIIGKSVVTIDDSPGYVVDRLKMPYLFEAMRMYERGHGSMRDIDVAMKLGCGYKMGPFELCDHIGLDRVKAVNDNWRKEDPNNPLFAPSVTLDNLVAAGNLGKKTGSGFFKYKQKKTWNN